MSCNILLCAKNKKQVVSVPHDPSKIDEAKIEESPIAPHEASFFPQEVFHHKMSHILMGREGSPDNPSPPQRNKPLIRPSEGMMVNIFFCGGGIGRYP